MKVQIIYSSNSGSTEKLANAIYEGVECEKSIHNLKDGKPALDGDIILFGYYGISGHPCEEMSDFLREVRGKVVGVFATLGYYCDTEHAFDTVRWGVDVLKENNTIIGSYVCNGKICDELKGDRIGKTPTLQKEVRWEITDSHPSRAELELAKERFCERIRLYSRCKELSIDFKSVL